MRQYKRICDDFARWASYTLNNDSQMRRLDVNPAVFARQLVTATLSELFRHEFEETKWSNGLLVPIDRSLSDGATEYSYLELQHTGLAEIVSDNATDLPRSEIQGQNNVMPIKTVGCSFSYSTQEVRSAALQGMFNIPAEKSLAARTSHDFAINNFIRDGVPASGLDGFTNAPGITVQTAAVGSWTPASTPADIVSDFTTAANTIIIASGGVEVPDHAVFPLDQFTTISTLQNSTASDITVLDFLKKAFPMITTWEWEPGLATASAAGGPAAMIYKKDMSKARAVMPMMLQALAPEQRGLTFIVNLESRFGGVMAPKPGSMLRLEGI